MAERLDLKAVRVRAVAVPLKRPVVSKVGLFREWPMRLIDLETREGVVGRSDLEPFEWQDWADPILAAPFERRDGPLVVPDRPGTGIEWSEAAVERYAI